MKRRVTFIYVFICLLTLRFRLLNAKLKDRIGDNRNKNRKTGDKIAFVLNYCHVNLIKVLNKIQ